MTGVRRARRAALAAIAVLVGAASLVSFAESYRGLLDWASRHGLSGPWAVAWPLQVDTFIAVGELALFVALADRWPPRSRAAAWLVTLAGLAVSVAGNVGHVAGHSAAHRVTAAVPPLAAAAALTVGLGVLKRVVALSHSGPDFVTGAAGQVLDSGPDFPTGLCNSGPDFYTHPPAPGNGSAAPEGGQEAARLYAAELARGEVPSIRRVRREMHVGQPRAQEVRAYLAALAPSTSPDGKHPPEAGFRAAARLPPPGR
jgi:hypothetical protein